MVAIKDANGKYTLNFRKCVIIEVVEKQTSIREAVRIYWNVYTRREEDLYTKTVRSWIKLFNKFGVYIMNRKKTIDLTLRKEDFRTNEELLAFEDFDNIEETAKTVQRLKLALLQQQQLTEYYKKKHQMKKP